MFKSQNICDFFDAHCFTHDTHNVLTSRFADLTINISQKITGVKINKSYTVSLLKWNDLNGQDFQNFALGFLEFLY